MKSVIWLPASCALALFLCNCSNNSSTAGNNPVETGPFDNQGNYREDWVADPSKWKRPGKRQMAPPDEVLPVITQNEQPPANANPLGTQTVSNPRPNKQVESTPRETVKRTETTKPVVSKPKPKPVVVKAKPKPKPKTTRYIVKKGDNLSSIASRNGSSVSAIQRANGISGTMIRPGQSLVVPKR